jgi:hypothetical protein
MDTEKPTTLNLRDASRLSGLSSATLRRMCQENRIRHARLSIGESGRNTYLVYLDALEAIIKPYEPSTTPERPKKQLGRPRSVLV